MEKAPNHILQDVVNKLSYQLVLKKHKSLKPKATIEAEPHPIWITGMFRSGTTILTRVLQELGLGLGPSEDLLQAKGTRATLNPDGFYENYLLMEWSLYVFKKLDGWGDQPPTIARLENFDLESINYKDFVYDAIVNNHDDRISNADKVRLLSEFHCGNVNDYFQNKFGVQFGVKNPHFMLLSPLLDRQFPLGKYIVIFRNPSDTINSAKQVSPRVNLELWCSYYSRMIDHPKAIFVSLENLCEEPCSSISTIAQALNLNKNIASAEALIQRGKSRSNSIDLPDHIQDLYEELKTKSIN